LQAQPHKARGTTFLPNIIVDGAGLPFGPASQELANLTDSILAEFGKVAEFQRLAAIERYGLSRSEITDAANMRIEVQADAAESMDRDATRWLQAKTMRRVRGMQPPPPIRNMSKSFWMRFSDVQDGWFIRYEGHEDLIEAYRDRAMINVLGCAESEALAHNAMIGGSAFAEWRADCMAALGRVFNHIA
jgi:hypothetical protein